jgi:outer membrane protein OmpA-like peptidoglycan-associated protein
MYGVNRERVRNSRCVYLVNRMLKFDKMTRRNNGQITEERMKRYAYSSAKYWLAAGVAGSMLLSQGCVATRDWVREQMDPLSGRVSQAETRLTQTETQVSELGGRMGSVEGRLGQIDGRLGELDAKTERALNSLSNLRLERRAVIDMKEGANFGFNSAILPSQARKEIDGFLSDLKGDANEMGGTIFVVAGHTDASGSDDYNYELGKRRADAVSRYLITQKKMDPLRVVTVSYGKTAPAAENNTAQGRAKNRRVEILVYREAITSSSASAAQAEQKNPQQSQQQSDARVSQR